MFWLQPVMVITASMQPKWGRIQLPASNLVLNLFPRKLGSCCVKLARIHSGWSGQVLAEWIWFRSKPVCKNYWAQSRLNAAGLLPVSHFQTRLRSSTDSPDHIVQNQPRSSLVLAVSGLGQMDPVRKQVSVQESSGPLPANASEQADPDPIWHVHWV